MPQLTVKLPVLLISKFRYNMRIFIVYFKEKRKEVIFFLMTSPKCIVKISLTATNSGTNVHLAAIAISIEHN